MRRFIRGSSFSSEIQTADSLSLPFLYVPFSLTGPEQASHHGVHSCKEVDSANNHMSFKENPNLT